MEKKNTTWFRRRHKSEHTLVRDDRIFDKMDHNTRQNIRQLPSSGIFRDTMCVSCAHFQPALFVCGNISKLATRNAQPNKFALMCALRFWYLRLLVIFLRNICHFAIHFYHLPLCVACLVLFLIYLLSVALRCKMTTHLRSSACLYFHEYDCLILSRFVHRCCSYSM